MNYDCGASDEEEISVWGSWTPSDASEKGHSTKTIKLKIEKIKDLIPENFEPEPTNNFKFEPLSQMSADRKKSISLNKPFDFMNI